MSEYDALDAIVERVAREEQEELDRAQGQFILDVVAAEDRRKHAGEHPLLEAMSQAHQAKAQDDEQ